MSAASDPLQNASSSTGVQRLLSRLADSRFFTVSLLMHVLIVVLVGGTVLFKVSPPAPDFEAGGESSFVADAPDSAGPPETQPQQDEPEVTQPTNDVPTPALTTLLTTNSAATAVVAAPISDNPLRGMEDNMKNAMDSAAKKAGDAAQSAASNAMARAGGKMKTAMLFNKKVEAAQLGVVLDVSGSAHPHLAAAIKEVEKGFGRDAIIILYPGCGMKDIPKKEHFIRKLSSIKQEEIDAAPGYATGNSLKKAMKIEEFSKVVQKNSLADQLYISWYNPDHDTKNTTGYVQGAFEELMNRNCDAIYWFADFRDRVDPKEAEKVIRELKRRKVKVHERNFAGRPIPPEIEQIAKETGGNVDIEKTDKK